MDIQLITTNEGLESCISSLSTRQEIAVDLEFDKNYYRYGFNLCLLQVFDGDSCYLIDPLSENLNVDLIFPVLENREIQKVVFAFGEDLRLLHSMNCLPQNIYDVSIATSLLNYPPASLVSIISDVLEIDTGKSSQMSNWFKRPLTEQQLDYASQDVLHLLKLKEQFEKEAEQKEISSWIEEENEVFDRLNYTDVDDINLIKDKDKKDLSEYEWHLFKNLMDLREKIAEKNNVPGFKIIHKNSLIEIAKNPDNLNGSRFPNKYFKPDKQGSAEDHLAELLKKSKEEARRLGLSTSDPANKPLSKEEYAELKKERSKVNQVKESVFKPIKKRISQDYGSEAASFMLSNRIISEIITGECNSLLNYKKELLLSYAKELNLDIHEHLL
ncbi:MAG TPA: ribonuclease D [Balneolaceae bacterium]|nr:ribonuclease D [Balneolaceae bacterium]